MESHARQLLQNRVDAMVRNLALQHHHLNTNFPYFHCFVILSREIRFALSSL